MRRVAIWLRDVGSALRASTTNAPRRTSTPIAQVAVGNRPAPRALPPRHPAWSGHDRCRKQWRWSRPARAHRRETRSQSGNAFASGTTWAWPFATFAGVPRSRRWRGDHGSCSSRLLATGSPTLRRGRARRRSRPSAATRRAPCATTSRCWSARASCGSGASVGRLVPSGSTTRPAPSPWPSSPRSWSPSRRAPRPSRPPTHRKPVPVPPTPPETASGGPPEASSMEPRDQDLERSSCGSAERDPSPPPTEQEQPSATKEDREIARIALAERMKRRHARLRLCVPRRSSAARRHHPKRGGRRRLSGAPDPAGSVRLLGRRRDA